MRSCLFATEDPFLFPSAFCGLRTFSIIEFNGSRSIGDLNPVTIG